MHSIARAGRALFTHSKDLLKYALNNFDSDINEGANFIEAVRAQLPHAQKMSFNEREMLFYHCLITRADHAGYHGLREVLDFVKTNNILNSHPSLQLQFLLSSTQLCSDKADVFSKCRQLLPEIEDNRTRAICTARLHQAQGDQYSQQTSRQKALDHYHSAVQIVSEQLLMQTTHNLDTSSSINTCMHLLLACGTKQISEQSKLPQLTAIIQKSILLISEVSQRLPELFYRTPNCYHYLNALVVNRLSQTNSEDNTQLQSLIDQVKNVSWEYLQNNADEGSYSQLTQAAICYISMEVHQSDRRDKEHLRDLLTGATTRVIGLVRNHHKRALLKTQLRMFDS